MIRVSTRAENSVSIVSTSVLRTKTGLIRSVHSCLDHELSARQTADDTNGADAIAALVVLVEWAALYPRLLATYLGVSLSVPAATRTSAA
jgi:hypothetical protein